MENDEFANAATAPVRLAEAFAASEKFQVLFTNGMDLVEETASFLDIEGRKAAKNLSKTATAVYGSESMRLTSRLMQLASWLLLQRAVAEGEMTTQQVMVEKKNVKLHQLNSSSAGPGWDELPRKFHDLVERSIALQRRIYRLDQEIYAAEATSAAEYFTNPVASQHVLLETAFDPRFRN